MAALRDSTGDDTFAGLQVVGHLLLGWPVYLLKNDTAGRQKFDGAAGAEMALSTTAGLPPSLITLDTKIAISTAGIVAVLANLSVAMTKYGFWLVSVLLLPVESLAKNSK